MSQHIVHILEHGSHIRKERGMMICTKAGDDTVKELAIEDVRAVIVAARGVTITMDLVSSLLDANAVILHCDTSYKPVGVTAGVERMIRSDAAIRQADGSLKLHNRLWKRIVTAKVSNQSAVLDKYGGNPAYLRCDLKTGVPDEAACARHYWQEYFDLLGVAGLKRRGVDYQGLNARLNYGYAVLAALVHRSIIAHGLSPLFGMHHIPRYQAHAFVYDIMEPWRAFVDDMLVRFLSDNKDDISDMKTWAKHVAVNLRDIKLEVDDRELKLIDALDVYVSRIARCYAEGTVRHAWMPYL